MLSPRHLSLQINRVRPSEEWSAETEGVAFILPRGGLGKYLCSAVSHPLAVGDVLVIGSSAGGRIEVSNGGDVVFWSFHVQFEHLYPLFANEEICLIESLQDRFKATRLYAADSPVAAECHRLLAGVPPQFNFDHRSHILRVAATVLSAEISALRPPNGGFVRGEDHLKLVFERLTFQEILTLSVEELAQRFSCSRRHLNRLFHQYFGISVASLRMEMRLLKAASLLRDPNVKVINVAEQCGFNHLGLFNTCFRRRFSMSPGQWRGSSGRESCESGLMNVGGQNCPLRTNGLCPWSGSPEISPTLRPSNGKVNLRTGVRR